MKTSVEPEHAIYTLPPPLDHLEFGYVLICMHLYIENAPMYKINNPFHLVFSTTYYASPSEAVTLLLFYGQDIYLCAHSLQPFNSSYQEKYTTHHHHLLSGCCTACSRLFLYLPFDSTKAS